MRNGILLQDRRYHGKQHKVTVIILDIRSFKFSILGVLWLALAGVAHATPVDGDLLFFEYLEQERNINGQVTQNFALRFNGPELDFLDVYFQQIGDATLYEATVENQRVAITSCKRSFFRLFAFGGLKNRYYVAQADFPGFGHSEVKVERKPAIPAKKPVPLIDQVSPKFNYWPQTGQCFTFRLKSNDPANGIELFVMENGRLKALETDEKKGFSYTPAHDERLRTGNITAARQDTIIARITNGDDITKISYTMLLHRSRTAFLDQKAGFAVFLASAFLIGIWIAIKRKRSKTPW